MLNKHLFLEKNLHVNNAFVRLSQVRNEISDAEFSVDYDDDYLTKKNEEPPLPEGAGTSGHVNMSNVMISYDSMGKTIKSWNSHQMANIWLGL